MAADMDAGAEDGGGGLRTMFSPPWACMANCGACCYLAPQERDLRCVPGPALDSSALGMLRGSAEAR